MTRISATLRLGIAAIAVVGLIALAGWFLEVPARLTDQPTDAILSPAALANMHDLIWGPSDESFAFGYGSERELNSQRDRIAAYREKITHISDARVRAAYARWLDFFQRENDKARAEMLNGTKHAEWERYKKQEDANRSAIDALARSIPKP